VRGSGVGVRQAAMPTDCTRAGLAARGSAAGVRCLMWAAGQGAITVNPCHT